MKKTARCSTRVLLLILFLEGALLFIVIAVFYSSYVDRRRNDPTDVADRLIYALINANVRKAKSVTIPEQWDRIEKLMEGRTAFKCQRGDWETTGVGGVCSSDPAQSEWKCSLGYQCASGRTPYCFSVDDILVRKTTEDGWKVHDWGEMHEAFDYAYRCEEVPPLKEP